MKFYLTGLGNLYDNVENITGAIVEADRLGLDGALMPDHYMWGSEVGHSMQHPYRTLETWTTLTYLAGKTEQVRLGTLVTPLTFRHPGVLAKRLSTLDVLSGGRVVLGVGAGWSKVEFDGYSEWLDTRERVDKTHEALDIMLRLWTEPEVTYKSEHYELEGAVLDPKPLQKPYPRLLFGSSGKRMLRLTGRYGDICFIPPWLSQDRDRIKETVLSAAEDAGRANEIEFMIGEMGAGSYSSDACLRGIEAAEEFGASIYAVAFPRGDWKASMKKFSDEVMVSYR
ncbi:MAG TPA: LLM class flavin-dependent oxidoreductase [Candidatus Krumholzibacteriaceae bacterium]|nr:LLM class flavin-dependent oxidoreductase [Candidatus Krumholzibacteriaceae bacterium]